MHTPSVFFAVVVALAVSAPAAAEQKTIIKPAGVPDKSIAHDDEAPKATRKGFGVEQKPIIKPTGGPTVPITKPTGGPTRPIPTHDDESPKERVFRPSR